MNPEAVYAGIEHPTPSTMTKPVNTGSSIRNAVGITNCVMIGAFGPSDPTALARLAYVVLLGITAYFISGLVVLGFCMSSFSAYIAFSV